MKGMEQILNGIDGYLVGVRIFLEGTESTVDILETDEDEYWVTVDHPKPVNDHHLTAEEAIDLVNRL